MKKVLMIIAPENFRDEELFHTKEEIEKVGSVVVASKVTGEIKGMLGATAKAEITLDDVNINDYDAVIFVGGTGSAIYFDDTQALKIAKEAYALGKVVGAICIAPSILANAGILEGRKATCYPSEKDNIASKGAEYTGSTVEVDGKIVTGAGPQAAKEFGKKIAEMI